MSKYINTLIHNYSIEVNYWVRDLSPQRSSTLAYTQLGDQKKNFLGDSNPRPPLLDAGTWTN